MTKSGTRWNVTFQHPSQDEVTQFRRSVISFKGHWDPDDLALVEWAFRKSETPAPGVVKIVDVHIWRTVIKWLNYW